MFRDRIRTTAQARTSRRDWYRMALNAAADETRIDVYDEIGWFGVTAAEFTRDLRTVTSARIALHLNSPGGDVFDGIAIYNALRQHAATVNVTVDGIAASIASVIAMSGDDIAMAKGAMFMTHEPFAMTIGDANDHRKGAEALDKMAESIAGIYAARTGKSADEWRELMRAETWFGDQEAVDAGMADRLLDTPAAQNRFDLSIFRNYRGSGGGRDGGAPGEGNDEQWRREALARVARARLEVAACRR